MDVLAWDYALLSALNQFVGTAPAFDTAVVDAARNHLLKGGVLVAMLWWCWTGPGGRIDFLAAKAIGGAVVAIAIGRGLQNLLPPRPRPLHNPEFAVLLPPEMDPATLTGWGSFPSDNAALFFALSTAIWAYNRPLGTFAFAWSLIVGCLPRLYLGLHFPTDIAGGAVLGIATMLVVLRLPSAGLPYRVFEAAQRDHPKLFFAAGFLATFEIASLFEGSRRLLVMLGRLVTG